MQLKHLNDFIKSVSALIKKIKVKPENDALFKGKTLYNFFKRIAFKILFDIF